LHSFPSDNHEAKKMLSGESLMKKKSTSALFVFTLFMAGASARSTSAQFNEHEAAIRSVIAQFEEGLHARDLKRIEAVVADDLVVLENGHRNDGWQDFRDHHLIPEMKEPAHPQKNEIIKVRATPQMGWGYTKTLTSITRKSGEKATVELWSTYVIEKRGSDWKIVLLNWSIRIIPAR
jgi:ketosteroid isomerase-like protein